MDTITTGQIGPETYSLMIKKSAKPQGPRVHETKMASKSALGIIMISKDIEADTSPSHL
jgi:hypothetical protein